MNELESKPIHRRHLPHIQLPGCPLFVTFRLAGSVPGELRRKLLGETRRMEWALAQVADAQERERRFSVEQRRLFGKWDTALDKATDGPVWLQDSRVASLVADCLRYRDGRVYDLDAYCIMPNHVHIICTPLPDGVGTFYTLSSIMQSLKRFTARHANLLLGRQGTFWQ
jgi:putative transposase